ncbi:uncharacterized protein LOC144448192 [Glandiceps talaboti]
MTSTMASKDLDPFWVYLVDLQGDIVDGKLESMLNLSEGYISRRERDEIKTPYDMFRKLYDKGHLTKNNPDILLKLLRGADLIALANTVEARFQEGFEGQGDRQVSDRTDSCHDTASLHKTTEETKRDNNQNVITKSADVGSSSNTTPGQKQGKAALFVCSRWTVNVDRLSLINASLAASLATKGIQTYSTTLEVKAEQFNKDKDTGVILISALEKKVRLLSNKDPSSDWLIGSHRSLYPDMYTIPGVDVVVGHMALGRDNSLVGAALIQRDEVTGSASLFLFNHGIPEDAGDNDLEKTALEAAKEATAIWSIGPYVYDHFKTKYKALNPHPTHHCYYPALNEQFTKMMVQPNHEGRQQILTICSVMSREDFQQYKEIAIAMGKVAGTYKDVQRSIPKWILHGVCKDVSDEFKQYLQKEAKYGPLEISVYTSVELEELRTAIQQSVLLVAPEKKDPFNFPAFLAMQAGLPVLISSCSGLSRTLKRLFPSDDFESFCSVPTNLTDYSGTSIDAWKERITDRLVNKQIGFKKSTLLQDELKKHPKFKECQDEFVQNCQHVLGYEVMAKQTTQPKDVSRHHESKRTRYMTEPGSGHTAEREAMPSMERHTSDDPNRYGRTRNVSESSDARKSTSEGSAHNRIPSSLSSMSLKSASKLDDDVFVFDGLSSPMETDKTQTSTDTVDEQFERDTRTAIELSLQEFQSAPEWHSLAWCGKLKELNALEGEQCLNLENIKCCERDEFKIATGCEGTKVYLGINTTTGEEVAVKRVDKNEKTLEFIKKEEEIVTSLEGDNIVKYHRVIHGVQYVYIIMELCEKTLDKYVKELKSDKSKQEKFKQLVIDVLKGLRTLHNHDPKILHRDLKPANVLINTNGTAKLCDFGISRSIDTSQSTYITGASGTAPWQATEVAQEMFDNSDSEEEGVAKASVEDSGIDEMAAIVKYSQRSDIQVAGMIIAYILSGGCHPFGDILKPQSILQRICKGKVKTENMKQIADGRAKHLISLMLQKDRKDRPSINEVLRHPYFWKDERCCSFLQAVLEETKLDASNVIVRQLQSAVEKIDGADWAMTMSNPDTDVITKYPKLLPSIYDVILQSNKRGDDNWTLRENIKPFFTDDVI